MKINFEDLGYYTLGYNDHEIFYEKLVEEGFVPYFKRVHINLDYNIISASQCYITEIKWKNAELTVEEVDAVFDAFERYNNA